MGLNSTVIMELHELKLPDINEMLAVCEPNEPFEINLGLVRNLVATAVHRQMTEEKVYTSRAFPGRWRRMKPGELVTNKCCFSARTNPESVGWAAIAVGGFRVEHYDNLHFYAPLPD